jgi:hypothetical protein
MNGLKPNLKENQMFEPVPKFTCFSHGWTISEKIDGTNAAIIIVPTDTFGLEGTRHESETGLTPTMVNGPRPFAIHGEFAVLAQSRNKLIYPGKSADNHGFASWVAANVEQLIGTLGEGRHFGEWCGSGLQRRYGLEEKRFALFNTHRWAGTDLALKGGRLTCVPILAEGYMDDPGWVALECMEKLKIEGSRFAPGFMDPEGVVMRHGPSGTVFKKTFDYDEKGKWAEKEQNK